MEELLLKINTLEKKLDSLEKKINSLDAFTTIPFNVEQAFRVRFGLDSFSSLSVSSKSATSENQVVNESGSSTYTVLKLPDGFRDLIVDGTTLSFPYYT